MFRRSGRGFGHFACGRGTLPSAAKYPKRRRGLSEMRLVTSCLHLIHSAPRTPERTAALRKAFLASGAMVTGLCKRRLGCRPAQIQSDCVSTAQGACCHAVFVSAQVTGRPPLYVPIGSPQPGTAVGSEHPAGLHRQRQQAGAECVVTRCRVSGNQRLVLHQKEVLRNHGFLSAFFVSFVALQKTPAPSSASFHSAPSPQGEGLLFPPYNIVNRSPIIIR